MALTEFFIGDTKTVNLTIVDSQQAAVDITGWEFWLTLKWDINDRDENAALQVKAVMPADANSTAGIGSIVLTSDDTGKIKDGGYYLYDIQRVIPGNPPNVKTLTMGRVQVKQGVTRWDTDHVQVPDVLLLSEADAITALTNAGLVADVQYGNTTEYESGKVYHVQPGQGAWVEVGSTVAITVAN